MTAERHLAQATFRGSVTLVFPRQRILNIYCRRITFSKLKRIARNRQ